MVEIVSVTEEQDFLFVEAKVGKVSGWVSMTSKHVTVCCKNASHAVWRGSGKTFHGDLSATIPEALAAYKSAEMKLIVETAKSYWDAKKLEAASA